MLGWLGLGSNILRTRSIVLDLPQLLYRRSTPEIRGVPSITRCIQMRVLRLFSKLIEGVGDMYREYQQRQVQTEPYIVRRICSLMWPLREVWYSIRHGKRTWELSCPTNTNRFYWYRWPTHTAQPTKGMADIFIETCARSFSEEPADCAKLVGHGAVSCHQNLVWLERSISGEICLSLNELRKLINLGLYRGVPTKKHDITTRINVSRLCSVNILETVIERLVAGTNHNLREVCSLARLLHIGQDGYEKCSK